MEFSQRVVRIFSTRIPMTMPVAFPDPSALHLFPEPWTKLQGCSQELATRLSPKQLEYIFECILSGEKRKVLFERWNKYFQVRSMKVSLSTKKGIELWKKFCQDREVTSSELETRSTSQQNDQKRKEKVTIPPNSFPCFPC